MHSCLRNTLFLSNIQLHGKLISSQQEMRQHLTPCTTVLSISVTLLIMSQCKYTIPRLTCMMVTEKNCFRKTPLFPPELVGLLRPIIAAEIKAKKLFSPLYPSATITHGASGPISDMEINEATAENRPCSASATSTPKGGVSNSSEMENLTLIKSLSKKASKTSGTRKCGTQSQGIVHTHVLCLKSRNRAYAAF